jgi:hypothetical protein
VLPEPGTQGLSINSIFHFNFYREVYGFLSFPFEISLPGVSKTFLYNPVFDESNIWIGVGSCVVIYHHHQNIYTIVF